MAEFQLTYGPNGLEEDQLLDALVSSRARDLGAVAVEQDRFGPIIGGGLVAGAEAEDIISELKIAGLVEEVHPLIYRIPGLRRFQSRKFVIRKASLADTQE